MDDRRVASASLWESADLLESVWPDRAGKSVSEKVRLASEELMRIDMRQKEHLKKARGICRFCEGAIAQQDSDKQKSYGQKRRRVFR